ncbi:alkaline phosphatase PhoX [Caenispirillum salinarum]|uniref:alkaline phosphatase PhoX n=1 Tax=Caenispirillum salinarum TaxID=859058 RepID=UPI00384FEC82
MPYLPSSRCARLGGIFALLLTPLGAVGGSPAATAAEPELTFLAVKAPETDLEKRSIRTTPRVLRRDGEGETIGYRVIARSGQEVGTGTFGVLHDQRGQALYDGADPRVSDEVGFTSLLHRGRRWFALTQFGDLPGALYLSELVQGRDGTLIAMQTAPVDTAPIGGLWRPMEGGITPWDTHLAAEGSPPDTRLVEEAQDMAGLEDAAAMAAWFGRSARGGDRAALEAFRQTVDPYRYGHVIEADVDHRGRPAVYRRLALGRAAPGDVLAMPDGRTVYITDRANGGGLFMFVADEIADLSAGSLYAARWRQTASVAGGAADIEWVDLGHAREVEIARLLDRGLIFTDLFDRREALDGHCPDGFTGLETAAGPECLAVKAGMEMAASRLETRRYAAMLGATTELVRSGGLALDPARKRVFLAVGAVAGPMAEAGATAGPGTDHIALPSNPCGTIYAMSLGTVAGIASDRVATRASAVVVGAPVEHAGADAVDPNDCALNGIANPRGLAFLADDDTLIVAEDTVRGHQNDAVWAWDAATGSLSRLQTTPYGAAASGVAWFPHMGDWGYLFSSVAHPYGGSDTEKAVTPAARRGYLGYIGPFGEHLFN